jgi:hypothetical protein
MSKFLQGESSDAFAWLNTKEEQLAARKAAWRRSITRRLLFWSSLALLGFGALSLTRRSMHRNDSDWMKSTYVKAMLSCVDSITSIYWHSKLSIKMK